MTNDKLAAYPVNMDTVSSHMNTLLYGWPGVGKTSLAGEAADIPEMRDVLFLNFEGGLVSLAHRTDIKAVDIRSIADLEAAFWKLQRGEYKGVRTVVIDNLTEMQTLSLETIASARVERKGTGDRDQLFMEDYGKSTAQLRRLMRWFRDLPIHVIMTAHPKAIVVGQENVPAPLRTPSMIKPSLTDKLSDSVMGYVDFVWYYFIRETDGKTERVLVTRKKGVVEAKTRGHRFSEALGDGIIVNPTLSGLFKLFQDSQRKK